MIELNKDKLNDTMKNNNYLDAEMHWNKLDTSNLNIDNLNKNYSIIQLNYIGDKPYALFNNDILDSLAMSIKIQSISYFGGRKVFLLFKKGQEPKWDDILNSYKNFTLEKQFKLKESDKYDKKQQWKIDVVFNLLLNALAQYSKTSSNLNGRLYCYLMSEIIGKGTQSKEQIITISPFVKGNLFIRKTQSFIPYKAKKTKKIKRLFKIITGTNNSKILKPLKKEDDKNNAYQEGSLVKAIISEDILDIKKHSYSKVALLHNLIEDFDNAYKGIAKLEFCKIPIKTKEIKTYSKIKTEKTVEFSKFDTINLIVTDDINLKQEQINNLKSKIQDKNIKVIESSTPNNQGLNIYLIHNKEYFKEQKKEDIKINIPKNIISQCITIEELLSLKNIDALVFHVLNELKLKQELHHRKIKDWNLGNYEFYIGIKHKAELGSIPKHFLMQVNQHGEINIIDQPNKIDNLNFKRHINNLNPKLDNEGNTFNDGNICIVKKEDKILQILHTNLIPIMNKEAKEVLIHRAKNTIATRGKRIGEKGLSTRPKGKKDSYNKMAYPYIGKHLILQDDKIYYTIGYDTNPNANIPTINNIYEIKRLDTNDGDINDCVMDILDMLEHIYVRSNNAETVRPFPFKYLMEYIRKENPGKSLYLTH